MLSEKLNNKNVNYKSAYLIGASFMVLAIAIGAFGAHALESLLISNGRQSVFKLANDYHYYQALGLLSVGVIGQLNSELSSYNKVVYFMTAGTVIFCGSLYILAILNMGWLGAITPIGGVLLIVGWSLLAINLFKIK